MGYEYRLTEADEITAIRTVLKHKMGISTRLLRRVKDGDGVFLNGAPIKLYEKGKRGDLLTVEMPEENSGFEPEDIPIAVLYEDMDLLAVNKQPGYVVHPTKGHVNQTMANGLMHYMIESGEQYKIRFINRLDRDTSGILLIGKNSHCQDDFARQASFDRVEKNYIAFVHGIPEPLEGVIDLPIGKPVELEIKRQVMEGGYASVTHYRVMETYQGHYAKLFLTLETGRTHQIRVHLSHLGHPIMGDHLYGTVEPEWIDRQALHAAKLSFDHPITKQRITIEAALPEDMVRLEERLRAK